MRAFVLRIGATGETETHARGGREPDGEAGQGAGRGTAGCLLFHGSSGGSTGHSYPDDARRATSPSSGLNDAVRAMPVED